MNAYSQARTAYASPEAPVRTPRSTEAKAFQRVTQALSDASSGGAAAYPGLVRALHDNRKLWTVLAAHVADDGNDLPQDLRARIFYLAEFTTAHSSEVLKGAASPDVLVEINRAIVKGLQTSASASVEAST